MKPTLESRRLIELANTLGLETQVKQSDLSNSRYITITNPVTGTSITVRISNHRQAPIYRQKLDLEIGDHNGANSPETRTPKVLRQLISLSQRYNRKQEILADWAKQAEQEEIQAEAEADTVRTQRILFRQSTIALKTANAPRNHRPGHPPKKRRNRRP